ncbi:MAG: hypothetical protein LBJ31_10410 [Treponema sp.]|nr:hypothetical protein [Treponema sp.]
MSRPIIRLLKQVCLLGLAIAVLLAVFLVFAARSGGIPLSSLFDVNRAGTSSFARMLESHDAFVSENPDIRSGEQNRLLDALEKKAPDTGAALSVLKRRRHLARFSAVDREAYLAAYGEAARRVFKRYPFSGSIGAVAGDAIIRENPANALPPENAAELRAISALMPGQDIGLVFSVYAGMMSDPALALELPGEYFTLLVSLARGAERERYRVNAAIRSLLGGDAAGALIQINSLFDEAPQNDETYRFGAEYYYNHGNFVQAALLFNHFFDDYSIGRQGDSLYLGGFIDSARELWEAAGKPEQYDDADAQKIRSRVLYNLASTSPSPAEANRALEQLFAQAGAPSDENQGRAFAVIRYARLASQDRAVAILEQTDREGEGLFDLEWVRRSSSQWTVPRTIAETWLLLNRHIYDGRIYEWSAWYFDFQRDYEETAQVLRDAGINRVEGPWSAIHRAYAQLREGLVDEAEKTLRSISSGGARIGRFQQPLWQASANLGLVLDMRGRPEEALEHYENAMGILSATGRLRRGEGVEAAGPSREMRDASRIQLFIARDMRALGRESDSRRVLEYALDLDPENLEASLELRRLSVR